jgi:hypothetical protein
VRSHDAGSLERRCAAIGPWVFHGTQLHEIPPAAVAAARAIATGFADLTFCDKVEMFVSGAAASHAGEKRCRCHRILKMIVSRLGVLTKRGEIVKDGKTKNARWAISFTK